MKKIGLLSDTHSYWDEKYLKYFSSCDEIWHAGDIGNIEIVRKLEKIKPTRAVYGNIDGNDIQVETSRELFFKIENVKVYLTHIGGYPGKYQNGIKDKLSQNKTQLFICGHSHILKVMYDKTIDCLHINPGAAGKNGFHKTRTIVRFVIDDSTIKDLEVIELNDEKSVNE